MQLNNKSQAGNVFVIILGGVFLFCALMFNFYRSGSKGTGNLTKQQAKIAAQDIISYANTVEGAVNRIRRKGCSENEINFSNAVVAGYSNTDAPADGSCDIFSNAGGKIEYVTPQDSWLDSSYAAANPGNYATWRFVANNSVEGIDTPAVDLRITLNFLKQEVCTSINNLLGVDNPSDAPPVDENDGSGGGLFVGAFVAAPADNIGDDGGHNLPGKATFCREGNSSLQFSHVLLAR